MLTLSSFVEMLRTNRLLQPSHLEILTRDLLPYWRDPRGLAKELVQRGWLTVYQVNQLFLGQGQELVKGPYRVLEMLGEGGISRVYKAWHTRKNCVVALKVIKKELMDNPEEMRKFHAEMKVIAQLKHPNIVQTFGDDQEEQAPYFGMEYVEGIDLNKLVRLSGPLPVHQACDYVRQAALGLQHAHEHCLVHRDIKPANLYLTSPGGGAPPVAPSSNGPAPPPAGGVIKILDWGLADMRLPSTGQQEVANTLQREETLGTADYLAPEQAMDASKVDIRADIYSLGCTLYYLLTGEVPFPGGTLMVKLFKHQQAEPTPVEKLRTDLPPTLPPVVKRMMAKKPDNRYRTPASVTIALASFCKGDAKPIPAGAAAVPPRTSP